MCIASGPAKAQEGGIKSAFMARDSKGHGCGCEVDMKDSTYISILRERKQWKVGKTKCKSTIGSAEQS